MISKIDSKLLPCFDDTENGGNFVVICFFIPWFLLSGYYGAGRDTSDVETKDTRVEIFPRRT